MTYGGPNAAPVAELVGALERLPAPLFVHLARHYDPADQADRDAAWEDVREAVEAAHRGEGLDEIRATAVDLVTIRRSTEHPYRNDDFGGAVRATDRPEDQARVVNAIIEAAAATLVRDLITDAAHDLLAGPVLDLLAATTEADEAADRGRDNPPAGRAPG